jgi:hypothetical protein
MKQTWNDLRIVLEQKYKSKYPDVVWGLAFLEDTSLVDGGPILRANLIVKGAPIHLKFKDPRLKEYLAQTITPLTTELYHELNALITAYPELDTYPIVGAISLEEYQKILAENNPYLKF